MPVLELLLTRYGLSNSGDLFVIHQVVQVVPFGERTHTCPVLAYPSGNIIRNTDVKGSAVLVAHDVNVACLYVHGAKIESRSIHVNGC